MTIDETVAFTTENLDTGNQVAFEVDEETSLEATYLALSMYDGDGSLQPQLAALNVLTAEREFKRLEASVDGNETTFTDLERATYRTTMYRDGDEVGATEYEMTVGHQTEDEQSIGEDTIEISFNAGTLPTDGSFFGLVRPGDDRVKADETGYDADTHRFFATFDADAIPPGEHRTSLRVMNPSTERTDFKLPATLVVPEES